MLVLPPYFMVRLGPGGEKSLGTVWKKAISARLSGETGRGGRSFQPLMALVAAICPSVTPALLPRARKTQQHMQNSGVGAFLSHTSKIPVKSPKAVGLSKCVNWACGTFAHNNDGGCFITFPLSEADMIKVRNISLWVKFQQIFFFHKVDPKMAFIISV